MKHVVLCAVLLAVATGQRRDPLEDRAPQMKREQIQRLLKADREKSLEEAAQLIKLSEELKIELEKNDQNILSLVAIKKTEEIEKLSKRIRGRLRRY
jgi:GTP-binding protein EngB required for normal cell division